MARGTAKLKLYWRDIRALAKAGKTSIREARVYAVRRDGGKRIARAAQVEAYKERAAIRREADENFEEKFRSKKERAAPKGFKQHSGTQRATDLYSSLSFFGTLKYSVKIESPFYSEHLKSRSASGERAEGLARAAKSAGDAYFKANGKMSPDVFSYWRIQPFWKVLINTKAKTCVARYTGP